MLFYCLDASKISEKKTIGDIETFYFQKLRKDFGDIEIGTGMSYYDLIGIPVLAFCVNDKDDPVFGNMIDYALRQYCNVPLEQIDNKTLADFDIKLEFCKKIGNDELNRLLEKDMLEHSNEYITEEVLWKNMTSDEKAQVFSTKLDCIGCVDANLVIVDPYFFSSDENSYCNLLSMVLKRSRAKTVTVITERGHFKQTSYNSVNSLSGYSINLKYSSDYHDRFWIANGEKGLYTGTSFNGIGKRISLINQIPDSDVKEIIDQLKTDGLLDD